MTERAKTARGWAIDTFGKAAEAMGWCDARKNALADMSPGAQAATWRVETIAVGAVRDLAMIATLGVDDATAQGDADAARRWYLVAQGAEHLARVLNGERMDS